MTKVAVLGSTGRMGQTLVRLIAADERLSLVGAATEHDHPGVGKDAGDFSGAGALDVKITDQPSLAVKKADVAIDFTLPAALAGNVEACVASETALVVGTTGLAADEFKELESAARSIAVVYGRNMSIGVNVLSELVTQAAQILGDDYDVEIAESHHRFKLDAPSGTALQLGENVARGRGVELDAVAKFDRHGLSDARQPGTIGFASIRAGSIVGDHSVMFAADEEIIELRHRAIDRSVFARGALRAAAWAADQPAGYFSMRDVLGLAHR